MNNKPVAWINVEKRRLEWDKPTLWETPTVVKLDRISLYTHPAEHDLGIAKAIGFDRGYKVATAKTLTDEEIIEEIKLLPQLISMEDKDFVEFARAILRKAQEK